MAETSVAADVHQSLDVHLDALPEVALDIAFRIQDGTYLVQLIFAQVTDLYVRTDAGLIKDRGRSRLAYTVDVGHSNLCPLIGR